MQMRYAEQLKVGDQVYWNDPDEEKCSRHYTIQTIEFLGDGCVSITDKDGSHLECFVSELL